MNNKLSTLALFLAGLVCGFLIFEWITPTCDNVHYGTGGIIAAFRLRP